MSGPAEGKSLHLPEPEQLLIPLRRQDGLPGALVPHVFPWGFFFGSFFVCFFFFLNLPHVFG